MIRFGFIFCFWLLVGCSNLAPKLAKTNIAGMYITESAMKMPTIKVYRFTQDSIMILGEFEKNVLFVAEKPLELPINLRYEVQLFNKYESKLPFVEHRFDIPYKPGKELQIIALKLPIAAPKDKFTIAKLSIGSNQGPKTIQWQFEIMPTTFYNNQQYLITDKQGHTELKDVVTAGQMFFFKSEINSLPDSLLWSKISIQRHLPLPPFYKSDFRKPEIITDLVVKKAKKQAQQFDQEGIYVLSNLLKEKPSGISVSCRPAGYPNINQGIQQLLPLRYITSQHEFDSLARQPNTQKAVDDFWYLSAGADVALAEKRKKEYYGRVVYANRFFESLDAGWATDRGLIYVVYGPPSVIFKSIDRETWIYNRILPGETIQFWFVRIENDYSQNYYILDRDPSYESAWYQVVRQWRLAHKIGQRP